MDNKYLHENATAYDQHCLAGTLHKDNPEDDEFDNSDNYNNAQGYTDGNDMQGELSNDENASKIIPKEPDRKTHTEPYNGNRMHKNSKDDQEIKSSEVQKKPKPACITENISKENAIIRELDKLGIQSFQNISVRDKTERSNTVPSDCQNLQQDEFLNTEHYNKDYIASNSFEISEDSPLSDTHGNDLPEYKENEFKAPHDKRPSVIFLKAPLSSTSDAFVSKENKTEINENTASRTNGVSANNAIMNLVSMFNVKSLFSEKELSIDKKDKDTNMKQFIDFIDRHKSKIINTYKSTTPETGPTLPSARDASKDAENDAKLVQHMTIRKQCIEKGSDKCLYSQCPSVEKGSINKSRNSKTKSKSWQSASNKKQQNVTENKEQFDFRVPVMVTYRIKPDSNGSPNSYKISSNEVKKYLIVENDDDKKLCFIIKKMTDAQQFSSGISSLNFVTFNNNIPDDDLGPIEIPQDYDVLETDNDYYKIIQKKVKCCSVRQVNVNDISTEECPEEEGPPGYEECESSRGSVRAKDSDSNISMSKNENKLARGDGEKPRMSEKCPNIDDPCPEVSPSSDLAGIDGRNFSTDEQSIAECLSEMKIKQSINKDKDLSSTLSASNCAKSVDMTDVRGTIKEVTTDKKARENVDVDPSKNKIFSSGSSSSTNVNTNIQAKKSKKKKKRD